MSGIKLIKRSFKELNRMGFWHKSYQVNDECSVVYHKGDLHISIDIYSVDYDSFTINITIRRSVYSINILEMATISKLKREELKKNIKSCLYIQESIKFYSNFLLEHMQTIANFPN